MSYDTMIASQIHHRFLFPFEKTQCEVVYALLAVLETHRTNTLLSTNPVYIN